ncbi:MAG: TerD family protein [Clostridium perfringens]|nr:TerD family protein [Clostridium perfringens]
MALNFLKKLMKGDSQESFKNNTLNSNSNEYKGLENQSMGPLNLNKNDVLDLTKRNPSINNIILAAGWDASRHGSNIDLDLVAFLLDENGKLIKSDKNVVYYAAKKAKGIFLNGDNLTGEGDGDDEKIFVNLSEIVPECTRIVFSVVIYQGKERRQNFQMIKKCYVRLLDSNNNEKEICRYNLSEDGENNTAIIFADLHREKRNWNFAALGELRQSSMRSLYNSYKN